MTELSQGPQWWQASDLKWYPPERHPNYEAPPPAPPPRPAERPPPEIGTPPPPSGQRPRRRLTWPLIAGIVLIVLGLALPSLLPTFAFAHILFLLGLGVLLIGLVQMAMGKMAGAALILITAIVVILAAAGTTGYLLWRQHGQTLPFTGLHGPYRVAVDSAGNLYVTD
jgi:Family of unknown function (DUF6131)